MSHSTERTSLLPKSIKTSTPSPSTDPKPTGVDPRELSKRTRTGILAGIWTATFLAALNTTLVATLLTTISSSFSSAQHSSHLGTSYLLAHSAFTPLYGRLSTLLGRRAANQLALSLLLLGTLGCGLAPSMSWLVAARFVAGCGGGGLSTTASVVSSDLYGLRERSLMQGVATLFSGLGTGLGGPVGGWVSDGWGWRAAFLVQLPLFILSYTLTQTHLHYTVPSPSLPTSRRSLLRIDYLGTLLLLLTVSSSLFFLSSLTSLSFTWSEPRVWGSLLMAVGGALGFLIAELRIAVEPVLDPRLLSRKIPLLVAVSSFLVSMSNFAVIYFLPPWFETVGNTSSAEAGLHLLPGSLSLSLGSLFAGWYLHKRGKYRTLNLVSGLFSFLASLLLINLSPRSGIATQWLSIIPLGFGSSIVLQTTFIALLASVSPSQIATATGFAQLFRGLGQVVGVAGGSAVFQSVLVRELRARLSGAEGSIISHILKDPHSISRLPPALQQSARSAFGVALRWVFACAAGGLGIAFIVRLGIPEQRLSPSPSSSSSPSTITTSPKPQAQAGQSQQEEQAPKPYLFTSPTSTTPPESLAR